MSFTRTFGFLAVLAAPVAAFWRLPCKSTLVVERADPIVNPGNMSGHVHQIMGGNGFDFEMDYADTQASTCTSCTVHGDFSNYWTPALYYQHQDGTFEKVDQIGGGLVYYLQRTGPNNDKLQAFPEGFRMISGDPFKRASTNDFASQAVSYACLDYNSGGAPETGGFPTKNCPSGLRSQVFFPACWDGVNLDSADHKSHVAFPIGAYNDGKCPDTHPVHLISIFFEIIWDTNKFKDMWYGGSQPFVWAMGDPTGYGFHGDFLMGWDRKLLQSAVDTCTSNSGRVEDCPVFQLYPDSVAQGCKVASKIDEDIQGPFAKLPGCNPVQKGPDRAQIIKTCDGNNATIGEGKAFFKDLTSSGWGYQGCGLDNYYNRALTGARTSQDSMTNEQCVKFCGDKGFSIAGSEYGKECYCANSIPTSAQPVPGVVGNCDMPCAGDATQKCGGAGTMNIYQKCSGSSCSNAAGLGGSSPASGSKTSTGSPSATSQAGTKSSSSSTSKSTASQAGSQPVTSSTSTSSQITQQTKVQSISSTSQRTQSTASSTSSSSTATSTGSRGAATNIQGGSASTSVTKTSSTSSSSATSSPGWFSIPVSSDAGLPPNWSYLDCYEDTVTPRTLGKLAPYTIAGKLVTSTSCATYCSQLGYSYAGTEYAGECFCANSLPSGAKKLDQSKCNMPCKGDSSQSCGGKAALSLYADLSKTIGNSSSKRAESGSLLDMIRSHMKRHEHKRYARNLLSG